MAETFTLEDGKTYVVSIREINTSLGHFFRVQPNSATYQKIGEALQSNTEQVFSYLMKEHGDEPEAVRNEHVETADNRGNTEGTQW